MDILEFKIYKEIFMERRTLSDIAKMYAGFNITSQRIRTFRDVFADQEIIPDGFADVS